MERRTFFKISSAAALATLGQETIFSKSTFAADKKNKNLIKQLVKQNDERVPVLLNQQEKNKDNRWYGGHINDSGIHTPQGTAALIKTLICTYTHKDSKYHHDTSLIQPLEIAADYMLKCQHDDGTIDLHTTNFHSTPDTAFVLEVITAAYFIFGFNDLKAIQSVLDKLQEFILKGAKALTVGGIHTPNHRWVVSMALSRINKLFPDPKYIQRIDQWLSEKIDIDPDGQFTEKSSSIYSPLTDRCFITMARLLGREELLEPVRKNLNMSMYYFHPDGEVVTNASTRQDKNKRSLMAPYYYPYRYMAIYDRNGQYAKIARWIEQTSTENLTGMLSYFMEDEFLAKQLPANKPIPDDYCKVFKYSQIARIRRKDTSATILADNSIIFSLHKGTAALEAVRFAGAFFGKGQFVGDELVTDKNNTFLLKQKLSGPYYQPYPADLIPGDGVWENMPRKNRPQSEVQVWDSQIKINEENGAFLMEFDISGTDNVPVAIEMGFRSGGKLEGVVPVDGEQDAYILEKGFGKYTFDNNVIQFGPGKSEHTYVQLRGALPKLDLQCVYITGFTPFKIKLYFK